jgi:hypothetical protein
VAYKKVNSLQEKNMNTQFTDQQKPTLVNVIAWMTLTSGIVNLFWGLIASGTALATLIGVICTPITILPTILGIFEIIYAAKLLGNPPQLIQPSTNIAIFEIISLLAGNVFSMIVGILALVFYNDLVVKDYFARLNGIPAPIMPVVSTGSAPIPKTNLAPIILEPTATPVEESPIPQPEEDSTEPRDDESSKEVNS